MIPKLYSKENNYIGDLTECSRAMVIEERNGMFELEIDYQLTSPYSDYLLRGNIIIADANDNLKNQMFRIYKVTKNILGRFSVYCRHISYDIARDRTEGLAISNQSCEYCLNMLFRNSLFSGKFTGYSNIVNAQDYNINATNLLSAIVGERGSILDTFGTGAEIFRDNYNFHVLNKRGHDNGVVIEYASNLTGLDYEEDEDGLITKIRAIAKYKDENDTEHILSTYVESDKISNYETPFVSEIDFSEKFEEGEEVTVEKLVELAEKYFSDNKCDVVKYNYKVDFIPLSKCVGYENIEDKIELCDIVTIIDSRYNLNTKAKVIKTTFNVLKDRYESMELGEPRTSLGDIVGNNAGIKGEKGDKGDKGEKGEDGSIGDFPTSLPSTPIVTTKVYGFSNIEISWTFENKVYYQYEVYASEEANFTPNTFNLIHSGQTSTYMFQAKPDETWYFKVCAINTYGDRTNFGVAHATTVKIDDLSNYVGEMAIGDALIGELNLGRGWYGELKGNYIDAKQLSVTDGNGKRTLDIDSFGNVSLDVTSLKISNSNVATQQYAKQQASVAQTNANNTLNDTIKNYYTKTETDSKITVLNDSINLKASKTEVTSSINSIEIGGENLIDFTDFSTNKYISKWSKMGGNTGNNITEHFSDLQAMRIYSKTFEKDSNIGIYTPNYIKLEAGQEYTLSFSAKSGSWTSILNYCYIINYDEGGNNQKLGNINIHASNADLDMVRSYITFKANATINKARILIGCADEEVHTNKKGFYIKNIKLEKGNKPTAWCLSNNDINYEFTNTNNTVSSLTVDLNGITSRVSNVETKQTTTSNDLASLTTRVTSAETQLTQTEKDFNFKIENVGAENLIKNSDFSAGLEQWEKNGGFNWHIPINGSEISHNFGKMICIHNSGGGVGIYQRFDTIKGQKYTVSFYTEGFQQTPTDTVIGIEGVKTITLNVEPTFKRWSFTFTATSNRHTFVAYLGTAGKFYLGRVMVTQGSVLQEYRKHTSEIYSTTVKIDVDGIEIDSTGANTINKINTDGMVIKDKSDNTDLLKATSSGVVARGGSFYVDDPNNGYTRLWGRDIDINGQRALVGTNSSPQGSLVANKLYINYDGDFKNGTEITGNLTNNTFNVLSDCGTSLGLNGYIKLSNGLIIQWGHVMSLTISDGRVVDAHVKYPIDFPNAILAFIPSIDSVDGHNHIASRYNILGRNNNDKTHGWVYAYNWTEAPLGALMDINYIAIGC